MVFAHITPIMVVVYAVMVSARASRLARWLVTSPAVPALLLGAYVVWLVGGLATGHLQALACGAVALVKADPGAGGLSAALGSLFHSPGFALLSWCHLLLLDWLLARDVMMDGLNNAIPTGHSLVLCFMVGPLGMMSHLLTKAAVTATRGQPRKH